ncbi:carbon starvation CstA family protein, partial [Laribacter hongkongensis]
MKSVKELLLWGGVGILGAFSLATVALNRGESINAVWLVVAAVSCYFIAYRFYSRFIAATVTGLDARRRT